MGRDYTSCRNPILNVTLVCSMLTSPPPILLQPGTRFSRLGSSPYPALSGKVYEHTVQRSIKFLTFKIRIRLSDG